MKTLKYIVMAALAATAVPLQADMLYWMVDNPQDTGGAVNFAYATVFAQYADHKDPLSLYSEGTRLDGVTEVAASENAFAGGVYSGDFITSNVKSFLVELYDTDGERVAWQKYLVAEALSSIWDEAQNMTGGTPLLVNQVVPEPTSGLLLLFGGALLALRRGRARPGREVVEA